MAKSFLEEALGEHSSFVIFGDRLHWLGNPSDAKPSGNYAAQIHHNSTSYFPLSHGTPVSDLEALSAFEQRDEYRSIQDKWMEDNISLDRGAKDYTERYRLVRFIVDELFPRMMAAPEDERLEAILTGKKVITGKEIIKQALGDQIIDKKVTLSVNEIILQRLESQLNNRNAHPIRFSNGPVGRGTAEPSILSNIIGLSSLVVLGKGVYAANPKQGINGLTVSIDGHNFGCEDVPMQSKLLIEAYNEAINRSLMRAGLTRLKDTFQETTSAMLKDLDYMPLMDLNEFRFKDIGFFRNGNVYYIYKRLPKFARQTVYDENLFLAKEYDSDGYAGDFGIGLHFDGQIRYLGYQEYEGGVVYRGPIKKDAPFHSRVDLIDPVAIQKYGQLSTICHVGGYPHFPMTPDGFIEFMTYAMSNFLDSFRARFITQHHDAEEQARLVNSGKLLNKQQALDQGYMLTNIHPIGG
jgi:hypothetical protein